MRAIHNRLPFNFLLGYLFNTNFRHIKDYMLQTNHTLVAYMLLPVFLRESAGFERVSTEQMIIAKQIAVLHVNYDSWCLKPV